VIPSPVCLHDILDCESFVAANIQRSGVILRDRHEREDLLAEGLVILLELASRYEPHRAGYAKAGSFAGYAAKFLPGRMRDAYHALHPEHVARRDADGRRVYSYGERPMSLQHEDMPQLMATALAYTSPSYVGTGWDPGPTVSAALARVPAEFFAARRVVQDIDDGFSPDEIARRRRMNRSAVAATTAAVGSAIWFVTTAQEAA
jgi:hypothetical protein